MAAVLRASNCVSRFSRHARISRLSDGSAIVAESCELRVNSGIFDKRVSHEPGEC